MSSCWKELCHLTSFPTGGVIWVQGRGPDRRGRWWNHPENTDPGRRLCQAQRGCYCRGWDGSLVLIWFLILSLRVALGKSLPFSDLFLSIKWRIGHIFLIIPPSLRTQPGHLGGKKWCGNRVRLIASFFNHLPTHTPGTLPLLHASRTGRVLQGPDFWSAGAPLWDRRGWESGSALWAGESHSAHGKRRTFHCAPQAQVRNGHFVEQGVNQGQRSTCPQWVV